MRNFTERFFSKVTGPDGDGCRMWLGAVNECGYGIFGVNGRCRLAHRVAYEIAHGPIPTGAKVLHSCDTPGCVSVSHLRLGTQADNVADMKAKGRQAKGDALAAVLRRVSPKGERHWAARLSSADVAAIRSAIADGASRRSIARRFGVNESNIRHIERGRSWAASSR